MTHKIKYMVLFLVFFLIYSNFLAQKLDVYENHINLNKVYQQGTIVSLSENNDIRIYSSSNHQTENSVAINTANPNNAIISTNGRIVYNSSGNFVTVHQPYFYTLDGGITWNGSENNPNGINSHGDPVVLFDASGNAYYVTLGHPNGIYVLKSTNGGATWGTAVNADPVNSGGDDKEHAAADVSGTYPNNIYVSWTDFNTTNKNVVLTRSTNSGASFGNRVTLYSGSNSDWGQGTNIAIGPNGEVYVAFAYYNGSLPESSIRFTKSTNGGSTFSTANVAFPISGIRTSNGGVAAFNNTRVNSFPSMEVDRSAGSRRGWIYIVYSDKNTGDSDIYLRRSNNGGATWSSAIRVNNDPVGNGKQQWLPSIDVDEVTGCIYVSYYNMDANGFLTARYVAMSDDGGNTFNCVRISDVRFTPTALGAGYSSGYMGDYYETAVYNSKFYTVWSDNREGKFQAYISPGVVAHQYLSDNSSEVGNMGHWETSQFVNYSVPAHFQFSNGETHVLRSTHSVFSNEKYNKWNYDDDVKNFRGFNISQNTNELTSKLKPTYSGVSVRNSNEGTSNSSGSVQFKDPWYRDYADPSYGNNVRNRGSSAIFHSKSSPFYITTSSAYQGVFLGQGYSDPNKPYYSVKTTSPQTIYVQGKNRQFYFQNWEGSGATFQNVNNLETPVVFNSSNATVKAVMKGVQLSNNSNAFAHSNQHKIVKTSNGYIHKVYESMGKIWYERSTNGGSNWTIVNNGHAISSSGAKSPSIDADGNDVVIAYQKGNYIKVRYYTNANNYEEESYYHSNIAYDAEPTIALNSTDGVVVVYKHGKTSDKKLKYLAWYWDYSEFWWVESGTIPNTTSSSVSPTIAGGAFSYFHIAWQQNASNSSSIKYIKMLFDVEDEDVSFESTSYKEISDGLFFEENINPSIACGLDIPTVAWVNAESDVWEYREVHVRTHSGSGANWGTMTYLTDYDYDEEVNTTINNVNAGYMVGYVADGDKVKYYTSSGTHQYIIPPKYVDYVQVCNGSSFSSTVFETFKTNNQPYVFQSTTTTQALSKGQSVEDIKGRILLIKKGSTKLRVRVEAPTVDGEQINFVNIDDTTVVETKEEALSLFTTEEFELSNKSNFSFNLSSLVANESKEAKSIFADIKLNVVLLDAKTNEQLGLLKEVSSKKLTKEDKGGLTYKVNTKGIGNRTVKLLVSLDPKTVDDIVIAKTSTLNGDKLNKDNQIEVALDKDLMVTEYALSQNYPNPFNPSTTINYQIPKDGFVSLKVYDITGQEVMTLVNKEQSIGKYNVTFDASSLSSGVYLYRIQSGSFTKSMKMILLK